MLREQFSDMRVNLRAMSPRVLLRTSLPDVLETFEQRATVVRVPLYLLTAEIVLLALYYVVMVAALAVRQVEREFATLGSRGASRGQIFAMQLIEAGVLSIVALVSGPGLGALLATREPEEEQTLAHEGEGPAGQPFPNSDSPVVPVPGTRPEYTPVKDHYKVFLNLEPTRTSFLSGG